MNRKLPTLVPLTRLADSVFVRNWAGLFGEPPAALLDDRREMLDILVETVPVLTYPVESRPISRSPDEADGSEDDRREPKSDASILG
ncbi:hypothetical protein JNW90_23485 [Micromonospora sp. STR1s_5]|nr:hypothetical protein [Micromonospora sp. STR1s_5]